MEKVIIFSIFGFLFSLIGTKYLKEYLERKKVFDIPNERSSHTKPMPKGGGWIIVIFLMILIAGMPTIKSPKLACLKIKIFFIFFNFFTYVD